MRRTATNSRAKLLKTRTDELRSALGRAQSAAESARHSGTRIARRQRSRDDVSGAHCPENLNSP